LRSKFEHKTAQGTITQIDTQITAVGFQPSETH